MDNLNDWLNKSNKLFSGRFDPEGHPSYTTIWEVLSRSNRLYPAAAQLR